MTAVIKLVMPPHISACSAIADPSLRFVLDVLRYEPVPCRVTIIIELSRECTQLSLPSSFCFELFVSYQPSSCTDIILALSFDFHLVVGRQAQLCVHTSYSIQPGLFVIKVGSIPQFVLTVHQDLFDWILQSDALYTPVSWFKWSPQVFSWRFVEHEHCRRCTSIFAIGIAEDARVWSANAHYFWCNTGVHHYSKSYKSTSLYSSCRTARHLCWYGELFGSVQDLWVYTNSWHWELMLQIRKMLIFKNRS